MERVYVGSDRVNSLHNAEILLILLNAEFVGRAEIILTNENNNEILDWLFAVFIDWVRRPGIAFDLYI